MSLVQKILNIYHSRYTLMINGVSLRLGQSGGCWRHLLMKILVQRARKHTIAGRWNRDDRIGCFHAAQGIKTWLRPGSEKGAVDALALHPESHETAISAKERMKEHACRSFERKQVNIGIFSWPRYPKKTQVLLPDCNHKVLAKKGSQLCDSRSPIRLNPGKNYLSTIAFAVDPA